MSIHGFDPLAPTPGNVIQDDSFERFDYIVNEAIKGTVNNILRSYTGFYDVFSEAIQNALDATQKKRDVNGESEYQPRVWINIDLKNQLFRIVDNGIGMNEDDFLICFRPNVSFKRGEQLCGNKGVGATFLAYRI